MAAAHLQVVLIKQQEQTSDGPGSDELGLSGVSILQRDQGEVRVRSGKLVVVQLEDFREWDLVNM